MKQAYRVNDADNVAMLLQDVAAGECILVTGKTRKDDAPRLAAVENILAGHKVALRDINPEDPVLKYGAIIGVATRTIKAGTHVHIHNLRGLRGRGDKG